MEKKIETKTRRKEEEIFPQDSIECRELNQ